MSNWQVSDNDAFVDLVRVAQGDSRFRKQLLDIILLDSSLRQTAVLTFAEQLKIQNRPPNFIAAVLALADDKVANKVKEVVEEFSEEDLALTRGVVSQLLFAGKAMLSILSGAALAPSLFGITGTILWANFTEIPGNFDLWIALVVGLFIGAWVGGIFVSMCSRMFVVWFALLSTIMFTWNVYLYDAYDVRFLRLDATVLSVDKSLADRPEDSEKERFRMVTYRIDNVIEGQISHKELRLRHDLDNIDSGIVKKGAIMNLSVAESREGIYNLLKLSVINKQP